MSKRFSKHKKTTTKLNFPDKTHIGYDSILGDFPLNPSNSDRISFSAERNKQGEIIIVNNISYMMLYKDTWEWIIRYDDHGGDPDFHKHERLSLKDDSEVSLPSSQIPDGSKTELFEWAIKDIKLNHLHYRASFCKRSGIDLY